MYSDEIWNGRTPYYDGDLDDVLGEFISDYDYEAILDEVTEWDYSIPKRFWKDLTEDEFWAICEAHAFVG